MRDFTEKYHSMLFNLLTLNRLPLTVYLLTVYPSPFDRLPIILFWKIYAWGF